MGNAMCCSDVSRSKNYELPPQQQPPQVSPLPSPRQLTKAASLSDTTAFGASNHTKQGSDIPPLPSDLENKDKDGMDPFDVEGASDSDVEEPPRAPVNWQKGELLGSGAFGRVFKCMDMDTGELFAVKQVQLNKEEHNKRQVEDYIRTVKSEIAHLSKLKHENIVQYKGTSVTDDCLNIFLEYVPGGSVASLLAKFGPFHETVIRIYTRQILQGLEYMHKLGFMHRDIKGANILVDKSSTSKASVSAWRLKLADFGASKEIENLATIGSGAAKSVKGTPYWMAPEIIKQTGHGRPADIWSVGCTVIEMATGKPPWIGMVNSPVTAMFHIASSRDPPPIPDHLSQEALDFLLQCFNRVPTKRPNASTLLKHPFVTRTYSSGTPSVSPERVNNIPRAPTPLRLPPTNLDETASNRSPTAGTPPSPGEKRVGSRRSHARSNSETTVCYSPLTLSKKEGALLQATVNSSKAGLSARSKDSTESHAQASPTQRRSVVRFGMQSSTATSPLKSSNSSALKSSSSALKTSHAALKSSSMSRSEAAVKPQLLSDASTNDEPSLMTPKQPDEGSYNQPLSYLSESYNPMEEPSWIPNSNQDIHKMLRSNYSTSSPRYDDSSYRDQDKRSSGHVSGDWSFGVPSSHNDSNISTPNMSTRVRSKNSRQSSGSDHLRYRASNSLGNSGSLWV